MSRRRSRESQSTPAPGDLIGFSEADIAHVIVYALSEPAARTLRIRAADAALAELGLPIPLLETLISNGSFKWVHKP